MSSDDYEQHSRHCVDRPDCILPYGHLGIHKFATPTNPPMVDKLDTINHPPHYGGADNLYEAIKVIEAWKLGFNLGNVVKYICRADKKGSSLDNLKKALWYLTREIENLEKLK